MKNKFPVLFEQTSEKIFSIWLKNCRYDDFPYGTRRLQ